MRNLRLLSESHLDVHSQGPLADPISWLTVSTSGAVCGGSRDTYTIRENPQETIHQAIPPEHSHIIGTEFLVAENVLFLATSEGTLLLGWETEMSVVCHIPAGISAFRWSPDQEILVVTTNQDHEGGHLLLMTADWMPVATEPLNPDDFGEQKPVTVGWGKKETQFHGSEGKEAAKAKSQLTKTVSALDDLRPRIAWRGDGQFFAVSTVSFSTQTRVIRIYDRQGVLQGTSEDVNGLEWTLAWKPSGALIASTVELPQRRDVVFFEKNGLRHGGFSLPVLEEKMHVKELQWNSSSEILLVFLTPNPSTPNPSTPSTLLSDVVQLWTVGNYHWYLKQTLRYGRGKEEEVLKAVGWSQMDLYKLYFVNAGGRLTVLEWTWDVCRSTDDSSTVAVIDGRRVLLTALADTTIPPPASDDVLLFPSFVNQVVFNSTNNSYQLAVATDNRKLFIFARKNQKQKNEQNIEIIFNENEKNEVFFSEKTHFLTLKKMCEIPFLHFPILFFCGKERLVAVEGATVEGKGVWGVWTFSIHDETQRELESLESLEFLEEDKNCKLISYFDSPVYHFAHLGNYGLIYLKNGQVVKADLRSEAGGIAPLLKLPPDCDKITVDSAPSMSIQMQTVSPVIYTLNSASHKLYRNGVQLNDACTSFILTPDFLLYTTHHHKLISIPIRKNESFGQFFGGSDRQPNSDRTTQPDTNSGKTLDGSLDQPLDGSFGQSFGGSLGGSFDERQVERGARLITTVTNQTGVLLQLPRGNLELIHPRSLVIKRICDFLKEKKYAKAFDLVRRHRINMNILVDFDIEEFMKNISLFVKEIKNSNSNSDSDSVSVSNSVSVSVPVSSSADLNVFIAELSDENVLATMYRSHFVDEGRGTVVEGKCNRVLEGLEKVLDEMPGNEMFLSRLACYIYKKPQELEKALFRVMDLMKSSQTAEAEEALKFILYSTNVDELYNVALGTYDFDLVLMVATKSRKDPKEYIPFLNQFRAVQSEGYQKFKIDSHLKRFKKALSHLAPLVGKRSEGGQESEGSEGEQGGGGGEKFTELVELVVTHQLYKEALGIFKETSEERRTLLCLYGDYLSKTKKKYAEAAIMYDEGGNAVEAVENYRKALDWQMAVACAIKAGWDEKAQMKSAELTALSLKGANRYSDAAKIFLNFTKNTKNTENTENTKNSTNAFSTLLEGRLWADAFLLLETNDCGSDSSEKFQTALTDSSSSLRTQIDEINLKVEKFQKRLKIARKLKRDRQLKGPGADEFIDNMSETTSVSERSSMRSSKFSRASSKNRRKEEKKKRSLREGGPYEDFALLDALKGLFKQTEVLVAEVASLLKFLVVFGMLEVGRDLQKEFTSLVKSLKEKRDEIWTVEELNAVATGRLAGHVFGPDATTSSIVSGLTTGQESKETQLGDLSLADLALFVPPDFSAVDQWNSLLMDQLE